jgi:methyl-accepting chemotaxis protein
VVTGSTLVNRAGQSLEEIVKSVMRVGDIIEQIAVATTEQSSGINEINTAISQMDEMTQQNAALVEETNAAVVSLAQKGEELSRLISFFQIDGVSQPKSSYRPSAPVAHVAHKPAASAPSSKPKALPKPKATKTASPSTVAGGKEDGWEEF